MVLPAPAAESPWLKLVSPSTGQNGPRGPEYGPFMGYRTHKGGKVEEDTPVEDQGVTCWRLSLV